MLELLTAEPASVSLECLELVARGLEHERCGDEAAAGACMDRALALDVPLPAVLLQCGRFFQRVGRLEDAHHCFALVQNARPSVMEEFLAGLSGADLARYSPWQVRSFLTKLRPQHWFYPPIKSALRNAFGAEAAALAFAQMTGNQLGGVATLPLTSLHAFAASRARVYEELAASRKLVLPSPPVFRGAGSAPLDAVTRTFFFCELEDAVVSSKSNLLLVEGCALLDYQRDELDKVPVDISTDPIVFVGEGEIATDGTRLTLLVERGATTSPPVAKALTLVGVNSYNFGHWLLEFLPKLWACLARPGFEDVEILVDEQMPPQHLEAVRFFVGSDHPVRTVRRGAAVRVDELWTCSTVVYVPLAAAWGASAAPDLMVCDGPPLTQLLETIRPRLEALGAGTPQRWIYLTRKDAQHRRLVNRLEVEAWFAERGFAILDFWQHSFHEQLELVRGAEVIVGPDGSSLMTTFFARPGTRIGVLDNPYLEDNEWYGLVCAALGQHLLYLTGEVVAEDPNYRFRSPYRLDLATLGPFLDRLLAA